VVIRPRRRFRFVRELLHRSLVAAGAAASTLVFFLVLPLTQAITEPASADVSLRTFEAASLPPPPPPPQEEPEEEPEEEEPPPELAEEAPPLDLSMLELALEPGGFGDGYLAGDFELKLNVVAGAGDGSALFDLPDLDQEPRPIYQPGPILTPQVRKKGAGTVWVIFIVDERGRVETPKVQSSPDPVFERPALAAVSQWKFEPGKRKGEPVRSRSRVAITFPGTE